MAVQMPLPNRISQDIGRTVKQRLLTAQFNDGYIQSAPDGPASIFEEFTISWTLLTKADRDIVTAALRQGATDLLLWTPPGDGFEKKYMIIPAKTATLYTETFNAGRYYNIATAVMQVS